MDEVTAVLEIISSISSTLALDEILTEITEKTAQIVGADGCAISRWDRQNDTVVVKADYISLEAMLQGGDVDDIGMAYSLLDFPATARVLREHVSLIVYTDDPTADKAEKDLLETFQWGGVLILPMVYKGQAIGLMELYVDDEHRGQFTEHKVALCQALANQAAVAIENARLFREAEKGRLYAEALQVIGRALASDLDYESVVRKVADFVFPLVGAQFVCVAVPETNGFRSVAIAEHNGRYATTTHSTDTFLCLLCQACLNYVTGRKIPRVVADIQRDPACASCQQEASLREWCAMATIPLLSNEQLVGILVAYAGQPNFFDSDKITRLMALASQAANAIQNAQLFKELEAQREALRRISQQLVNTQEEERRRLSRELHDELGQTMTALRVNLDIAHQTLPAEASPEHLRSIDEASRLAVQIQETARSLSLELRPAMLDDLGLVSVLYWEIDRFEQRTGQTIDFETNLAGVRLQPELEITIYRIITEALTNVARHADASRIRVFLQRENNCIVTGVEDDGLGFDAANWFKAPVERQSLGLVSMRERAGLLGGQLQVISKVGCGTKVSAQFPTVTNNVL